MISRKHLFFKNNTQEYDYCEAFLQCIAFLYYKVKDFEFEDIISLLMENGNHGDLVSQKQEKLIDN